MGARQDSPTGYISYIAGFDGGGCRRDPECRRAVRERIAAFVEKAAAAELPANLARGLLTTFGTPLTAWDLAFIRSTLPTPESVSERHQPAAFHSGRPTPGGAR